MQVRVQVEYLSKLIESQAVSLSWYSKLAMCLLGLAMLLLSGCVLSPDRPYSKEFFAFISAFLAAVTGFPIKEYMACRDKKSAYETLKSRFMAAGDNSSIKQSEWDYLMTTYNRIVEVSLGIGR